MTNHVADLSPRLMPSREGDDIMLHVATCHQGSCQAERVMTSCYVWLPVPKAGVHQAVYGFLQACQCSVKLPLLCHALEVIDRAECRHTLYTGAGGLSQLELTLRLVQHLRVPICLARQCCRLLHAQPSNMRTARTVCTSKQVKQQCCGTVQTKAAEIFWSGLRLRLIAHVRLSSNAAGCCLRMAPPTCYM